MPWIREGECCRCGECCKGNPFVPDGAPDEMCPLLEIVARPDGTRFCSGHGVHPYYLQGCNVWPSIPEHVAGIARCTYRWRWAE